MTQRDRQQSVGSKGPSVGQPDGNGTGHSLATVDRRPPAIVVPPSQLLIEVSKLFPPQLSAGQNLNEFVAAVAHLIGHHPDAVLHKAYRILTLSRRFPAFPAVAEIADAILAAYGKLSLPFSPDAQRMQADREALDTSRYRAGSDGRRRFSSGARLGNVHFHRIEAHHANMVLDEVPDANPEHVERAVIEASDTLKSKIVYSGQDSVPMKREVTLAAVHRELRRLVADLVRRERHGEVEAQCGGPVAVVVDPRHVEIACRTDWCALSRDFIARMSTRYARPIGETPAEIGCRIGELLHSLAAHMDKVPIGPTDPIAEVHVRSTHAFLPHRNVATINPSAFGKGLQQAVETYIEARLSALVRPKSPRTAREDMPSGDGRNDADAPPRSDQFSESRRRLAASSPMGAVLDPNSSLSIR